MINSVKATIIVGCTYDEFFTASAFAFPDYESANAKIVELGLVRYSSYVDGTDEHDSIVGLIYKETSEFAVTELNYSDDEIATMCGEFDDLVGISPNVYLMPVIS